MTKNSQLDLRCLVQKLVARVLFSTVRVAEKLLPIPAFLAVLKPFAAAWELLGRRSVSKEAAAFLGLPNTSKWRARGEMNKVLSFFPDRLANPRWRDRTEVVGLERLKAFHAAKRPVVLAFVHSGPFYLLRSCLVSLGVPVATLVAGRSDGPTRHLRRLKFGVSPIPNLPSVFYSNELRELGRFLAAGNAVLVAVDRPTGRQVSMPVGDGWSFEMATGAIRLAALHKAQLVPCWITDEGNWKFRIEFGAPVSESKLVEPCDLVDVGTELLSAFMPRIRANPQQCHGWLLERFHRAPRSD